jgi:voltage-gated potassium channel Kch
LYYGLVCGWPVIDCVYFSTAIVTTVGYGDMTPPVEDMSLLFTCAYMIGGLVIVALALSQLLDQFVSGQIKAALVQSEEAQAEEMRKMCDPSHDEHLFERQEEKQIATVSKLWAFVKACALAMLVLFGGTCFYLLSWWGFEDENPRGEASDWVRALYFVITTLTTVGFGDDVPRSDPEKCVDVALMLIGIPVFGNLLASLSELTKSSDDQVEDCIKFVSNLNEGKVSALVDFQKELHETCHHEGVAGEVDRCEYMAFVLVRNGVIKMELVNDIYSSFNKLDADGSGSISIDDLNPRFTEAKVESSGILEKMRSGSKLMRQWSKQWQWRRAVYT